MTRESTPAAQNRTSHPLASLESLWLRLLQQPEPRSPSAGDPLWAAARAQNSHNLTRRARAALATLGLAPPSSETETATPSGEESAKEMFCDVADRLAPYLRGVGEGNALAPIARATDSSDGSFGCGPDLFVAPILHGTACTRLVRLPEGRWFLFPSGEAVPQKRRHIAVLAQAGDFPVFARAGAIVPLQGTCEDPTDARAATVHVFGQGNGQFALRHRGDSGVWRLTLRTEAMHLHLEMVADDTSDSNSIDFVICAIHGIPKAPDALSLNGMAVTPRGTAVRGRTDVPGWHYDHSTSTITIAVTRQDLPARITTSQPPLRTKPVVLEAKEASRSTWPSRGFARVATETFAIAAPGFERKAMEARVAASWQADGLCLYGEIDHLGPCPPAEPEEALEDGFVFVLKLAVGSSPVVVRFRITPTEDGVRAMIQAQETWRPHPQLLATWTRSGSVERCQLFIPSEVLGPAALIRGISCPFDWYVQRTDGLGRRGILEWQNATVLGDHPTGTITLG